MAGRWDAKMGSHFGQGPKLHALRSSGRDRNSGDEASLLGGLSPAVQAMEGGRVIGFGWESGLPEK